MKKQLQELWYEENNRDTSNLSPRDIGYHVGYKSGLIKAINLLSEREKQYTECDCGCNIPVASTPESMLKFLAGRLEFAGVSDSVARYYARDLRKLIEEHYG